MLRRRWQAAASSRGGEGRRRPAIRAFRCGPRSVTPPDFPQPVSGPAYGPVFRGAATAMLLVVLAMALRATLDLPADEAARQGLWVLGIGLFALVCTYWVLMRSTTTIDAQGIHQSGLIDKRVAWSEVRSAWLFGPPFARRLVVRTDRGRFRFFFGGSPPLLAAFERIARAAQR